MSILTNIFQRGWNHQLVWHLFVYHYFFWSIYCSIYLLRHVIFFDLFDTFNILGGIQPLRVVTTTNKFQLFNFHLEIWGNDLIWRTHICVPQPPPTLDPTNGQSLVDLDFLGLPIMFSSGIAASLCQQIRIEIKFTQIDPPTMKKSWEYIYIHIYSSHVDSTYIIHPHVYSFFFKTSQKE